jgi:hypothetical protein
MEKGFPTKNMKETSKKGQLLYFANQLTLPDIEYLIPILKRRQHNLKTTRILDIHSLPREILVLIFGMLASDMQTLSILQCVCRRWRQIFNDNLLWKIICIRNRFQPFQKNRSNDHQIKNRILWSKVYKFYNGIRLNFWRGNCKVEEVQPQLGYICMDIYKGEYGFSVRPGRPSLYWRVGHQSAPLQIHHNVHPSTAKISDGHVFLGTADGTISKYNIHTHTISHSIAADFSEISALDCNNHYVGVGTEQGTIRVTLD